MKKFNYLIYTIIYTIIFVLSKIILNKLDIDFMNWFYILSFILIYITAIIGIIQLILKIKDKILKNVLIIISTIIFIVISYWYGWFLIIFYKPINIMVKDNQKVVVEENGFHTTWIYYYKYINPLMRSYKIIDHELLEDNNDNFKKSIVKYNNVQPLNEDTNKNRLFLNSLK